MEKEQELEWAEAQRSVISVDLVAAAKQQLRFLAEVDRNRHLYDGPLLDRAILRYKYCCLPLLAKHTDYHATEGPLVVPLDCEWIWHCHRLNPVRYKNDCKELYGRVIDNWNVASTIQGICKKQTEEVWNRMFPTEPYELDPRSQLTDKFGAKITEASESTKYDLHSAVKRQSPFFYQISRPNMNDDDFLEEAVARYKGFLHLIKRNIDRSIHRFCVPTYDIDLIWHSHQLHPASYCEDLVAIMGMVLEHDDTDSNRAMGEKLDIGFSGTTKQWEDAFGSRYWKAGAMYRGHVPSTLAVNLHQLNTTSMKVTPSNEYQTMFQLSKKTLVEIMLEIVGVKDLPGGCNSGIFVSFSKIQPDLTFNTRKQTSIYSESGEKQVSVFQCEPTGELVFELMTSSLNMPAERQVKVLGTTLISLENLLNPISKLPMERWFQLSPNPEVVGSKPTSLRIALSLTAPIPAPYVMQMVRTGPLPKSWTTILDDAGKKVISFFMRESTTKEAIRHSLSKKEVIGMIASGKTHVLAEFAGNNRWSLMNSNWSIQLHKELSEDGHVFELTGVQKVIFFPGRKLQYELNCCKKPKDEQNFMTAIEFSAENPYGKAVALLNLKSGFLQIKEEWLVLPGLLLAFIVSHIWRKEGHVGFNIHNTEDEKQVDNAFMEDVKRFPDEARKTNHSAALQRVAGVHEVDKKGTGMILKEDCTCCGDCSDCGLCAGCVDASVEDTDKCKAPIGGSTCGRCDGGYSQNDMVKSGGCGGCGGGGGGCGGGGGGCGGGCRSGGGGGCGGGGRCGGSK